MAMIAVLATSMIAEARVFTGSGKANRVKGTKKADTIRLRSGNDSANGRGGGDRIFGGAGRDAARGRGRRQAARWRRGDRLHGGKGRDRLSGGGGNDTLNSVDKRKDALVSGGAGKNTCRIDSVDLSVVRGCADRHGPRAAARVRYDPAGQDSAGRQQRRRSNAGSATGLQCGSQLPTCNYQLSGSEADSVLGTVSGGGGVTTLGGRSPPPARTGRRWGCTDAPRTATCA